MVDLSASFFFLFGASSVTTMANPRFVALSDAMAYDGTTVVTYPGTTGTDYTTQVQAVLDWNVAGGANAGKPLCVLWDLPVTVSTIKINSNTHILALPNCGAILMAGGNCTMVHNAHAYGGNNCWGTVNGGNFPRLLGSFVDTNIIIEGGYWNGNAENQTSQSSNTYGWNPVFGFFGVEHLEFRGVVKILKPNTFGVYVANVKRFLFDSMFVDASPLSISGSTVSKWIQSSLVGVGPLGSVHGKYLYRHQIDNSPEISANTYQSFSHDGHTVAGGTNNACGGDIGSVIIDHMHAGDGQGTDFGTADHYGIGVFSTVSRIENITIGRWTGVTRSVVAWIDHLTGAPWNYYPSGYGNIGTISLNNMDLRVDAASHPTDVDGLIDCAANVDLLEINGWKHRRITSMTTSGSAVMPDIELHGSGTVNTLKVSDYRLWVPSGDVNEAIPSIRVSNTVGNVIVKNAVIDKHSGSTANDAPMVKVASTGGVTGAVKVDGHFNRISNVVKVDTVTVPMVEITGTHTNSNGGAALSTVNGGAVTKYVSSRQFDLGL